MSIAVMRDRVQRAISRLEQFSDNECESLAEAVAECLRQVQEHHPEPASFVHVSYEMLETS
jgi:galactose-1-phosphate uridylyltransferase